MRFQETLGAAPGLSRSAPSGYVESQAAFARRIGREMSARLDRPCPVQEADQTDFPEPLFRTNHQLAAQAHPEWSERAAWDGLADYYRQRFG